MSGIHLNQSEEPKVEIKNTSLEHEKEKTQEPLRWPQLAKRELKAKSLHTEVAIINKITTNSGLNASVIVNKIVKYTNNTEKARKDYDLVGTPGRSSLATPSCPTLCLWP